MGPDMVLVNREAPSIPPVLVKGGCDGGGFVELLAPGALAPLDAVILFGTAWRDDLYGHAALLDKFSKAPRNSEPLSAGPPDDDREGLKDALEGRPHVARRRGAEDHPFSSFGGGGTSLV